MKVWLDDMRSPPEGWVWVKDYWQAVELFGQSVVAHASLDHDLGFLLPEELEGVDHLLLPDEIPFDVEAKTGYDFLKWILEHDKWPTESLAIHSANPVGAQNMTGLIERYGPYIYKAPCGYGPPQYCAGWRYTIDGSAKAL